MLLILATLLLLVTRIVLQELKLVVLLVLHMLVKML